MRTDTTTIHSPISASMEPLSERLADAFRTGHLGDTFTDDVFLDGNPPSWRFQVQGVDQFGPWLADYTRNHPEVTVVHTTNCDGGFVTEHASSEMTPEGVVTSRKILLCRTRDDRISELVVYCSGDWDAELRARHEQETTLLRP